MKLKMLTPVLALALASCISLGSEPPPQLLTLNSGVSPASGTQAASDSDRVFVVIAPVAGKTADTTRVPVYINGTAVAYVKDAVWADKPARMLANVLGDRLAAEENTLVLDVVEAGAGKYRVLSGQLHRFGYNENLASAEIIYDAVLKTPNGAVIKRRFEITESVAVVEALPVGVALNSAANRLAAEITIWLAENR